jgi:hypothetical protein
MHINYYLRLRIAILINYFEKHIYLLLQEKN